MEVDEEELIKISSEKTVVLNSIFSEKKINFDSLLGFLMSTKNYDRQIIAQEYSKKFGKSIFDEINESKLNKDTKYIITLLFYNYYELDARTIHNALKEGKRKEKPLIEIFASRPSWFLQIVNDEYKRIYGITLKEELAQEKKTDFISFLQCILVTPRLKTNFIKTEKQAGDVVQEIIIKGLKKYGTDLELFKNLFVKTSREDLIYICREYKNMDKKKRNLYDSADDIPKGTRDLIKGIIFATVLPSHYFAFLLKKSIVGLGTDEELLSRVLVERHEIDMDFIRAYYKLDTGRELSEDIKGDTSGNYQKITMRLAAV